MFNILESLFKQLLNNSIMDKAFACKLFRMKWSEPERLDGEIYRIAEHELVWKASTYLASIPELSMKSLGKKGNWFDFWRMNSIIWV